MNSWVDIPEKPIPHQSTWRALSTNELLDVKNALLNKLSMCNGKPQFQIAINTALANLEQLLAIKLSDPHAL